MEPAAEGAGIPAPRAVRVVLQPGWAPGEGLGLLASDPRVRTLRKVLVTYPAVRYVLPDRISLEPTTDVRTLDSLITFLQRQQWLVKSVAAE